MFIGYIRLNYIQFDNLLNKGYLDLIINKKKTIFLLYFELFTHFVIVTLAISKIFNSIFYNGGILIKVTNLSKRIRSKFRRTNTAPEKKTAVTNNNCVDNKTSCSFV